MAYDEDPLRRRREIALALLQQSTSMQPVKHWTQALAQGFQGLVGGLALRQTDEELAARERAQSEAFGNLPGLSPQPASSTPSPQPATAQPARPTMRQPMALNNVPGRAPASIRYNNPGAQYPGPSARAYGSTSYGVIGGGHKIARFESPEAGAAAMFDLMRRNYSGLTLDAAIRKWSGGNNSDVYVASVSRGTGIDPRTPMSEILADPTKATAVARIMSRHEAGRDYPLTEEQWNAAYGRVFSPQRVTTTTPIGAAPAATAAAPQAQPQPAAPTQSPAQPPQQAAPAQPERPAGFALDPQVATYIRTLLSNPQTRQAGIQLYNALIQKYASKDPAERALEAERLALERQKLAQERELQPGQLELQRGEQDVARQRLAVERARLAAENPELAAELKRKEIELRRAQLDAEAEKLAAARDPRMRELKAREAEAKVKKVEAEIRKLETEARVGKTEFKEGQTKDAIFADKLLRSNAAIDEITKEYDPTSARTGMWYNDSYFNSQGWRQYQAAAREGVAAILRKETGAAVTEAEFNWYFPAYYPQPGDGPEVVAQKRARREAMAHGMRAASQGAYEAFYGGQRVAPAGGAAVPAQGGQPQAEQPPKAGDIVIYRGQKMRFKGGAYNDQNNWEAVP